MVTLLCLYKESSIYIYKYGRRVNSIISYGAQNQYLNGNPQMTFFKAVYRRYTNFSMDAIRVDFEGTSELSIDLDVQLRCKIQEVEIL